MSHDGSIGGELGGFLSRLVSKRSPGKGTPATSNIIPIKKPYGGKDFDAASWLLSKSCQPKTHGHSLALIERWDGRCGFCGHSGASIESLDGRVRVSCGGCSASTYASGPGAESAVSAWREISRGKFFFVVGG